METILSVNGLHKKFGRVHAVNNSSFTITKGNVYGILGPNGSGKSTTLGIILNVVNKTSGSYSWFNGSINTHQALKKVGAIIERPNFYPYMTAWQNLELVCKIKGADYSNINQKLELVGLLDRKDSKFRTFSLGMKQRLAIASALLNNPEILILDEPTNGLDPQGIHQIRDIIKQIAATGTTILLASHLLDEVEKVCTHVVVMQKGVVLYTGPVNGLSANEGFFELCAEDNTTLKMALLESGYIRTIEEAPGKITAYPDKPLDAAQLNRYLSNKGIYLTHLVKRTSSLEEQFLKLTSAPKNQ